MIYSDNALRNIIIENIDNKSNVNVACKLYCVPQPLKERDRLETLLTKHLLNKEYERPRPEKPITRTVKLGGNYWWMNG